ncbi:hypothetical protein C0Q70_12708 [Pomacea canaliculata]|uniref:Apple domain-containing protein n=1 Tax=Pomacea canaliculata TaxID=400727 RepID=A0A2T7P2A0_POMCA|nr:hypothetical protein C0Q70_12708 [Pomacea canaliculata]
MFPACNPDDLQNTFIAYPDSNIRGLINFGCSSESSVERCMERCVQTTGCLALDFHVATSLLTSLDSLPADVWSSVTSAPDHTYNSTCSSDSECSGINGHCVLGRCQCAAGFLFAQELSSCRLVESCVDAQTLGGRSGVYTIAVNQTSNMTVWCDVDSGDGGWLVSLWC